MIEDAKVTYVRTFVLVPISHSRPRSSPTTRTWALFSQAAAFRAEIQNSGAIRPQDSSIHPLRGMQQVMMLVPMDAYVNETQNVAEENRLFVGTSYHYGCDVRIA